MSVFGKVLDGVSDALAVKEEVPSKIPPATSPKTAR
jgi:hypothetical protein